MGYTRCSSNVQRGSTTSCTEIHAQREKRERERVDLSLLFLPTALQWRYSLTSPSLRWSSTVPESVSALYTAGPISKSPQRSIRSYRRDTAGVGRRGREKVAGATIGTRGGVEQFGSGRMYAAEKEENRCSAHTARTGGGARYGCNRRVRSTPSSSSLSFHRSCPASPGTPREARHTRPTRCTIGTPPCPGRSR